MAENGGVELPPRIKAATVGTRWLGVIPIAQAAVIGDVLVQLIALERHIDGALLTARISRLEEMILTEPTGSIPWPKLTLLVRDNTGTEYRVDGGAGIGSQSDWHVEYGISGALPDSARRLELTVTELKWEDLQSDTVLSQVTGEWKFTADVTRELPARMV